MAKNADPFFIHEITDCKSPQHIFIWLHGWGQDHKSLLPLADFFKDQAHHYLIDLPGFGKSKRPKENWNTADYGQAIGNWIKQQKFKHPVILIGHSFGCRVGTRLAANQPNLVEKMVYIGGAGIPRKRSVGFKIRAFLLKRLGQIAGAVDAVFKTHLKNSYRQKFGSSDYKNAGEMLPIFLNTIRENLSDEAQQINVPVLLIYGEHDQITPIDIGQKYHRLIKNSDLHILPGFDHYSVLSSGRHQVQSLMSRFIEKA